MFERFSEQARRILFFSRAEASKWGTRKIEPEHFLLAIIREGKGAAYELLVETLDSRRLSEDIEAHFDKKPTFAASIEIPFSTAAKHVLTRAVEEADLLKDKEVGPEHLLLGILRTDSISTSVLAQHGVTLELAREKL